MGSNWANSTRKSELPSNWNTLRRRVLVRDHFACVWEMDDGSRCGEKATDVDHIERGMNHSMSNLRSLCGWHHQQRTSRDGGRAMAARRARQRRLGKLPQETHPGLL